MSKCKKESIVSSIEIIPLSGASDSPLFFSIVALSLTELTSLSTIIGLRFITAEINGFCSNILKDNELGTYSIQLVVLRCSVGESRRYGRFIFVQFLSSPFLRVYTL
jgi:hypothetical protein